MTSERAVAAVGRGEEKPTGRRDGRGDDRSLAELVRIRAALAAGLAPVEALASVTEGPLVAVASAARLGRPLDELADASTERLPAHQQLLLRALAVAERAGQGGTAGVDHALAAIRDARAGERLLRIRSAQARGTANLLGAVPVGAWVLLIGVDPEALAFYGTPAGVVTGVLAVVGMAAGRWWSRRLVERAATAAAGDDMLQPADPPFDMRRAAAVGAPVALLVALAGAPLGGLVAAAAAGAVVGRGRSRPVDVSAGGTAEIVDLLALAMASGLSPSAAVGLVADVGPPAGRRDLMVAHRRLEAGWSPAAAFDHTRLRPLGQLLDAVDRWGAPAAPHLRAFADDLRADRSQAAEEAAERAQLALVFPTTLLILPSFALAIVPPLVWIGFAS